jgi:hypothetical protein
MVDTSGLRGGRRPCEQQLLRMAKRRLAILRHAEEITGNANRPPVTFYPKDCAGPPARCFAPSTQLQASARRPPCRARSVSTRGCSGARSVASWRGASTSSSGCWSPAGSGDRRPPRVRWRPMRGRFRRRVAGTHPDLRPPGHTEFHMAGRGGARTRQSSSEADSHHRGRKTHPSGRWSVRASGGYSRATATSVSRTLATTFRKTRPRAVDAATASAGLVALTMALYSPSPTSWVKVIEMSRKPAAASPARYSLTDRAQPRHGEPPTPPPEPDRSSRPRRPPETSRSREGH